MARLTIFSPDGRMERELLPHNTLGRHPENTIQLLDRIVSKEHCHVDQIDGKWVLKDLGSLNGTFVNGERVAERVLSQGDEISLGSTRMVFQIEPIDDVKLSPASAPEPAAAGAQPPQGAGAGLPSPAQVQAMTQAAQKMSRVTIAPGMVESHIRTKLQPLLDQNFLPERLVNDTATLRADYEKLRVSYEVIKAIGVELDVDKLLTKILDCAFQLLPADRGVALLYGEDRELEPRCVRTKKALPEGEDVVLSTTIINEVLRDKTAVLS
ncbi:MAG: FHA domain-containing protein, partial [Gammaproteobacteria bacterium]|nr:FHA domain-containing protein [Gammaproteobacteria bacterium]